MSFFALVGAIMARLIVPAPIFPDPTYAVEPGADCNARRLVMDETSGQPITFLHGTNTKVFGTNTKAANPSGFKSLKESST